METNLTITGWSSRPILPGTQPAPRAAPDLQAEHQQHLESILHRQDDLPGLDALVPLCQADPNLAAKVSACVAHMAWLSDRKDTSYDVELLLACFQPRHQPDSADLHAIEKLQMSLQQLVKSSIVGHLSKALEQPLASLQQHSWCREMPWLDGIASMLVNKKGSFDPTALNALTSALAVNVEFNRLPFAARRQIMDRLVLLKHLKQGPELARLIDEASRDTIHKRARPWMFISGREVDFTERANVARIVVVALLELPRQVDIGNCWLIADKLTVHDRAPADLLGQLREMLRQGVIRLGDRNGQPDFAVPPNVPVASSRVLKSELTIDVGDLDAGISHAALKLAFDTMFGPNMNLEKRKQMLSEAATIVGGKAQRHTAMVYEWVDALCSLLPEADPQYFKVASRHEERPLGFAPPDPNLDRLRTELDNFGAPEARVRMAFQSLQTSPLLKAWELAYGSAASSHLAARGWARIVRAIIDDPPQLPPSQGRHELLLALKPAFMQAARYEFRNSDFHPKGGSAFSRLFIRTANVPDGVEVKTPRIFEQALYVLVKEMPVPANADPKFEDCRQALMRILIDPSSGFAARTVGSSVNDEPGSSPWQLGEASWGGGVWDVSGANSAAWDLRKPTRTFTHEQPWYRVIRGTDPHSIDLLTANGRYASQTKIRSSDQYASRDTLEHLIVAMRAVDEADPKGLQTSIDAHGTLLIAMAGHFFRLLPQNFIDAWQGDGTKLSASDWIELQVEKPGQAFRQKQCPADEAREKVSAVLQRMDLTPEAQERIRQAVSNKADLKAGSNGEPLFTFGKLIDALASEFKEPPRTRELLCWAVMQTFDPLGELCVPVADTNWDARDSFRPVEGSLLCAYAYNLVEQQVSQWGAVQASHPDNPDASCLQYSVYLKELR